jgi:ribose 5-phosphate isomerase B
MVIYIGADHNGFNLKESLKDFIRSKGYEVADLGAASYDETDDYPKFAAAVAKQVSLNPGSSRGILICKSGVGVDIVANKFRRVRSALGAAPDQVFDARHDDDVNVLSLASGFLTDADAQKIVELFIETPFAHEERFVRRIDEISAIEDQGSV